MFFATSVDRVIESIVALLWAASSSNECWHWSAVEAYCGLLW